MKVFFILFAFIVLFSHSSAQSIPYQSHSFNDLNYIIQQLVKGIDSFKIDINTATYDSCIKYSTWIGSDSQCFEDEYAHKICCLAIKGDTSSAPDLNDYFNTTTDLVALLNNQKYDFIWHNEKRITRYNQTIYIAINIQYSYANTTQVEHWSLTKDWLAAMIDAIQTRNLDIKLILGRPAILNYYGPLCLNKSLECDENAQTIINYNFSLQGQTPQVNKSDFGVIDNFNIPFPSLPLFCSAGFPAYGDTMPYFLYEVAHELDVKTIVDEYTSSQCHKSTTHFDLSSVRITSNVDPEMIQSYLQQMDYLADLKTADNVLVEVLDQHNLLLTYFDTTLNVTYVQLRSLNESSFLVLIDEITIENSSCQFTKMSYKESYLFLHSDAVMQLYLVKFNPHFSLELVSMAVESLIAADMFIDNNKSYILWISPLEVLGKQTLVFNIQDVQDNITLYNITLSDDLVFDLDTLQSAKLSATLDSNNYLRAALFISAVYSNSGDYKNALYAYTINASLTGDVTVLPARTYIDFGIDPDVKLVVNNGTIFLLEAHSNGLCQCADYLNNGNIYKCGISKTSNPHVAGLQSMDYIMNYNWGRLEDFEARIQTGTFINACDDKIMHAKFYNGAKPNGVVYRNESSGFLQALFINEHIDYEDLPLGTKIFCGSTLETQSGETSSHIEVNTFNLVDFYLFNYL